MRHRFTFALQDEVVMDADVLDYIVGHEKYKRGDVIRTLLRIGFSTLVKNNNTRDSMLSSVDPDAIRLIINTLSQAGAIEAANRMLVEQERSQSAPGAGSRQPRVTGHEVEQRPVKKATVKEKPKASQDEDKIPSIEQERNQQTITASPSSADTVAEESDLTTESAPQVTQTIDEPLFQQPQIDEEEELFVVDPSLMELGEDDDELMDPMRKLGLFLNN